MGHAAQAQPVFDIPQGTTSVSLSEELEYFVDETGQWQPDSGEPAPSSWLSLRDRPGKSNFGLLPHPVWFRVVLRSPTSMERVWVVSTPPLLWLTWVQQRPGRPIERNEAGLGNLHVQPVPLQRMPTVRVALQANEPVTVHMRVQSLALRVPVHLWEPAQWQERERRSNAWLGAYFGLLMGLLAYNGFLALRLKDQAYGYYLGFGLSLSAYQLGSTGFGYSLFWPSHALEMHSVLSLAIPAGCIFSMLFTDSFLRMSRVSQGMHRVLMSVVVMWCIAALLQFWLPPATVMNWISMPLALLTLPLIMVAGVMG
jgi:hypothetical protein